MASTWQQLCAFMSPVLGSMAWSVWFGLKQLLLGGRGGGRGVDDVAL